MDSKKKKLENMLLVLIGAMGPAGTYMVRTIPPLLLSQNEVFFYSQY
jgi:hypothetical protein